MSPSFPRTCPNGEQPERQLVAAMLVQVWEDMRFGRDKEANYRHNARVAQHQLQHSRSWVINWTHDDFETPFTFPWCCLMLDIDPYFLRERILGDASAKKLRSKI